MKNPNPIVFLKIPSGVKLEFHFDLKDYEKKGKVLFSKEDKLELIKAILSDLGIGAKTNIGYGQLQIEIKPTNQSLTK
ncbi:MAG: hypothetical protein LUG96_14460 [Tannerellaceae bacterium]|nr:hypothetical protein [Tannerellaceae bacterium]